MRQLKITQQITQRDSISMSKYLQEISAYPLLTIEEEQTLPAKIQQGDQKALKRFIEGNVRFVISVAKQHQNNFPGERLEDLVGSGNIGLITAAYKYDVSRGFKFISYAVWWIRQAILQHGAEHAKSIRLPLNKITLVNKVKRAVNNLEQQLQRNPSADEIAEFLNSAEERATNKSARIKENKVFTQEDVEEILALGGSCASLDMPIGDEGDTTTMHDVVAGESYYDVNKKLTSTDLQLVINKVMDSRFTDREKKVINHFFGLNGHEALTLDEIGIKMDLTRERVRQIKEKCIRKVKHSSTAKQLQSFI